MHVKRYDIAANIGKKEDGGMTDESLQILASTIKESLNIIYGEDMAFMLCITPFDNDSGRCDYVGNTAREDAIEWMKETIERFEDGRIMDDCGGHA